MRYPRYGPGQRSAPEAIRAIAAPTLVVGADRDVMQPEGAVALDRMLPHAQLAILPNTEHMQITSRTDWLVPMVKAFLNAPPHPDSCDFAET